MYKQNTFAKNCLKTEIIFSRYALPGDSGVYECQISTEPKMSRLVRLSVAGLIGFAMP